MISNEPTHHEVIGVLNGVRLKEVPLLMLVPYSSQVMRNYGRTLKGIAAHRGMTSSEIVAVMEGRSIITSTEDELLADEKKLFTWIAQWRAHPECPLPGCIAREEPSSELGNDKSSTLFEAIKHGDEDHQAWLKAAIAAHFAGDPMPVYVEGRRREYIVRHHCEPYFVLLGRDPQAPALIEEWAKRRAHCEPGDYKVASAKETAASMQRFKAANPELGMPMALYKESLSSYGPTTITKLVLLGWRLDWSIQHGIGLERWCGADAWERKDRKVSAGAKAVPLYGRIEYSPSTGPSPWPMIKALLSEED